MTKVLTLDLSSKNTGWAFFDSESKKLEMGSQSFVVPKNGLPAVRFRHFNDWLQGLIDKFCPEIIIYEETFMSAKAAAYIHIGFYTRIEEACACNSPSIKTLTISPLSLKLVFAGSGKAEKPEMQEKALSRFPAYALIQMEDKGGDIADALALLWVWLERPKEYEPKKKPKVVRKTTLVEKLTPENFLL